MDHHRFLATRGSYGWIQKYIFPGGIIPSLTAIDEVTARHTCLRVAEVHSFGTDYAETLRRWRERFMANWPTIAGHGFDQTFRRMWEFYLAYCEAGFATALPRRRPDHLDQERYAAPVLGLAGLTRAALRHHPDRTDRPQEESDHPDPDGPHGHRPRVVLAYLADFRNAPEWDSGTVRCDRISGDGGVGTIYHNVSTFAGREVELDYIVESVDHERFVIVGRNSTTTSRDTITVTAERHRQRGRLPRRVHFHRAGSVPRAAHDTAAQPAR